MLKYLFICFSLIIHFLDAHEVWLIEQEFVRFGKKEVYETLKKQRNSALIQSLGTTSLRSPTLAIQDLDSSLYIYLTPFLNYAALDGYSTQMQAFDQEQKKELTSAFASTLNFCVNNLQVYLPECSYLPETDNCSFSHLPYVHYQIFSLTPGSEDLFEEHLKKMAFEQQMKKAKHCWRVWKVTYGGDIPKYIICCFALTKQALGSSEIQFIHQDLKEIVRRHRESRGLFRKDLSY